MPPNDFNYLSGDPVGTSYINNTLMWMMLGFLCVAFGRCVQYYHYDFQLINFIIELGVNPTVLKISSSVLLYAP